MVGLYKLPWTAANKGFTLLLTFDKITVSEDVWYDMFSVGRADMFAWQNNILSIFTACYPTNQVQSYSYKGA